MPKDLTYSLTSADTSPPLYTAPTHLVIQMQARAHTYKKTKQKPWPDVQDNLILLPL